jgi:ribosomal protein S18 acetylase RimI-like enzyme
MNIQLYPARAEDEEFLFAVYASTRASEMELVPWTTEQKDSFLRMQSRAQRSHYAAYYPKAVYNLVLIDGQPAGRLFLHRQESEIRIIDIALLPAYRGQGIGTTILKEILQEGRERNLPVTIHVERFNPALHLYVRLGFRLAEDKGVYYFLRWSPRAEAESPAQPALYEEKGQEEKTAPAPFQIRSKNLAE